MVEFLCEGDYTDASSAECDGHHKKVDLVRASTNGGEPPRPLRRDASFVATKVFRSNYCQMAKLLSTMIGLMVIVLLGRTTASAQRTAEQIESPASNRIEKHVHNYGDIDNTCIRGLTNAASVLGAPAEILSARISELPVNQPKSNVWSEVRMPRKSDYSRLGHGRARG